MSPTTTTNGFARLCVMALATYFVLLSLSGCAAPLMTGDPALKLKEPDAAFLKKVEKDPFPRANSQPLNVERAK